MCIARIPDFEVSGRSTLKRWRPNRTNWTDKIGTYLSTSSKPNTSMGTPRKRRHDQVNQVGYVKIQNNRRLCMRRCMHVGDGSRALYAADEASCGVSSSLPTNLRDSNMCSFISDVVRVNSNLASFV